MPSRVIHPEIVAHRGLHAYFPENSLGAFAAAVDQGLPWVECDVWASADGIPMVIHDATLRRTTFARGRVDRRCFRDLQDLRLRGPGLAQTLPSLIQTVSMLARKKKACGLLVEIKPPNHAQLVHAVCGILERFPGRWMIQSFDPRNLAHARKLGDIPVALLVDDLRVLRRAWNAGWRRIHVPQKVLHAAVDHRRRGDTLGVWTVNSPADLRRAMTLPVEMIITDQPLEALEMLRAAPRR